MRIICECGVNFRNMDEAYEMIRESKKIGAFLCKFQLYNEDNLRDVKDLKIREFLRSIMLDFDKAKELFEYGRSIGQEVFFSCMFEESVDWVNEIGCNYIKVRYRDNNNRELYQKIKKTKKFTFISINEYNNLWQNMVNYKRSIFLFCVPKYPAKIEDYSKEFLYGYSGISDHTGGIELLKQSIEFGFDYHEIHVKLDNFEPLENDWSVSFSELKEVLK